MHCGAGELPLCYFARDAQEKLICGRNRASKHVETICNGSKNKCPRFKQMKSLDDQVRLTVRPAYSMWALRRLFS